ncbi:MAG: rhomboid family intramembrane serine protease [Planctomycetes bacterium]|nr:rhomboid family intramembrane serine protease [Planctomycetota bacterium]
MRHIGSLPSREEAARFADYLLTQGVEVKAEEDPAGWAIWVRDENQLDVAREELEQFSEAPDDERYRQASGSAAALRREEQKRQEEYRRKTHEMRDRWNRPVMQRRPLTVVLIVLSGLVTLLSGMGDNWEIAGELSFVEINRNEQGAPVHPVDGFHDIKQGQLWRLVTPIFLHFDILHVLFNCYWVFLLGGMIEERRGAWRLGAMVLAVAVISNAAEYSFTGNPVFGGMSGVVYGLLGYIWMKMQFDPKAGFYLEPSTILILLAFLLICLTGIFPRIANTAHVAGLLVGMAVGYAPTLVRGLRS